MAEILGTNRGFELGDVTQFTMTEHANGTGTGTDYFPTDSPAEGSVYKTRRFRTMGYEGDSRYSWQKLVAKVVASPGMLITGSLYVKKISESTATSTITGREYNSYMRFLDDDEDEITSHLISNTVNTTTTWRQDSTTQTAPAGTAWVTLEAYYKFTATINADPGYLDVTYALDGFSLTSPGSAGGIIWF